MDNTVQDSVTTNEVTPQRQDEIRSELEVEISKHVDLSLQYGESNIRKARIQAVFNVVSLLERSYTDKNEYQFALGILDTIIAENDFTTESGIKYTRQNEISTYVNRLARGVKLDYRLVGEYLLGIKSSLEGGRSNSFFNSLEEINYAIAITIED